MKVYRPVSLTVFLGGDQNEHHSGSNVGRASSPASASSQTRQNQHSYQPPNYVQYSSELMPQSGMPPPASQGLWGRMLTICLSLRGNCLRDCLSNCHCQWM